MGAKARKGRPQKSSNTGPEFHRLSVTRLVPRISLSSFTHSQAESQTPRRPYAASSGASEAFSTLSL